MVVHLDIFCTIGSFYGIYFHSVIIKRYLDYFLAFDIFSSTFLTDFMSLQIHNHVSSSSPSLVSQLESPGIIRILADTKTSQRRRKNVLILASKTS